MNSRRRCGASCNARRNPRSAPDSHRPGASARGTLSGWAGASSVASSDVGKTARGPGVDAESDSDGAVEGKDGAGRAASAIGVSGAICEGGGETGTVSWAGGGTGTDAAWVAEFGARVSGG